MRLFGVGEEGFLCLESFPTLLADSLRSRRRRMNFLSVTYETFIVHKLVFTLTAGHVVLQPVVPPEVVLGELRVALSAKAPP